MTSKKERRLERHILSQLSLDAPATNRQREEKARYDKATEQFFQTLLPKKKRMRIHRRHKSQARKSVEQNRVAEKPTGRDQLSDSHCHTEMPR